MTSTTDNTIKATDFVSLSFFRIYVSSPQESSPQISVFRNSRQQCRIQVAFIAVDRNNKQILLTPAEIQSAVRLIRYTGGAEIPHVSNFSDQHEWYSTFTDLGYVWELSSMSASQALQDDIDKVIVDNLDIDNLAAFVADDKSNRIRSLTSTSSDHHWDKVFFKDMVAECRRAASAKTQVLPDIHEPDVVPNEHPLLGSLPADEAEIRQDDAQIVTFLVATFSNSSLAFAASIRSSTGQTFRTNHTTVNDPAGHGNGRGEFNSQVIVNSLALPEYPISAFGDFLPVVDGDFVLRDHRVYGSSPNLRAYEHYLRLTVDGKWIRLRSDITPGVLNPSIYNDVGDVGAEWSYSYTGEPGETALWHSNGTIGYFRSGNNGSLKFDSNSLIRTIAPHGIHRPRVGEIVIGQIMSDEHLQISDWTGRGAARQSRSMLIRDEQGNAHRVRAYLPNGHYKFNYIAIAKESEATNFVNLSFFRIYVNSPQDSSKQISVYRNTRQQCRIQVSFIAVDNQNKQILLTPAEIQSAVRLIRYTGGTEIPHGGDFISPHPEWYSSFNYMGYVWEPSSMAAAQALQDDIDKVIADNLDIDNLAAFTADDKSSRIHSLTSTSPEHHWDKTFFKDMVAEGRRNASTSENAIYTENPQEPVVPNERPLLASLPDEAENRQDGAQVVTFLVSTSSTSSLAFAASIRSSTGQTFRTNHSTVNDPAGHGNGRGEFNSQVIVNTLPQPQYPISAFGDFLPVVDADYVLRDHRVYGASPGLRAYEHYIRLLVDGKSVNLRFIVSPELMNTSVYNDVGDVGAEWSYSYTGEPGQTELHHRKHVIGYFSSGNGQRLYNSIDIINRVAPHGIHRPRTGEVVIGQVMSNDHWQISDWNGVGSAQRSRSIVIRDEQGNDHRLRLYLPNGHYKFNYIAIAKE